jgi:hypothetical protein
MGTDMKILLAVITCGDPKFKARTDIQRATWLPSVKDADVRFFLAKQDREPLADEVFLDVPDDYLSLPTKVKAMFSWSVANEYTHTLKLDDDTVLHPQKLLANIPTQDYTGFLNNTHPKPWCSGFAYWLSNRAQKIIIEAPIPPEEWAEDRWVGGVLHGHSIFPNYDTKFGLILPWMSPNFQMSVAICDWHPSPYSYSMEVIYNMMVGTLPSPPPTGTGYQHSPDNQKSIYLFP